VNLPQVEEHCLRNVDCPTSLPTWTMTPLILSAAKWAKSTTHKEHQIFNTNRTRQKDALLEKLKLQDNSSIW